MLAAAVEGVDAIGRREDVGYTISAWQRDSFRVLNGLTSSADNFDSYVERADSS